MTGKEHAETFYPGVTEYMQQAIAQDFDTGVAEGIRQQQAEIDRLKRYLYLVKGYAGHNEDCAIDDIYSFEDGPKSCDCGYSKLIAEIEANP
jgi:hypothetical protein